MSDLPDDWVPLDLRGKRRQAPKALAGQSKVCPCGKTFTPSHTTNVKAWTEQVYCRPYCPSARRRRDPMRGQT